MVTFSPVQQRMLLLLSDGKSHLKKELHKVVGNCKSNTFRKHLEFLRKKVSTINPSVDIVTTYETVCLFAKIEPVGKSIKLNPKGVLKRIWKLLKDGEQHTEQELISLANWYSCKRSTMLWAYLNRLRSQLGNVDRQLEIRMVVVNRKKSYQLVKLSPARLEDLYLDKRSLCFT